MLQCCFLSWMVSRVLPALGVYHSKDIIPCQLWLLSLGLGFVGHHELPLEPLVTHWV